jgi:hypothetical protein
MYSRKKYLFNFACKNDYFYTEINIIKFNIFNPCQNNQFLIRVYLIARKKYMQRIL